MKAGICDVARFAAHGLFSSHPDSQGSESELPGRPLFVHIAATSHSASTQPMRNIARSCLSWLAALAIANAPFGLALAEEAVNFNVPSQDAAAGLRALATQGDFSLTVPADVASGHTIHEVHGNYTAAAALDQALAESGLSYKAAGDKAYVVQINEAEASPLAEAATVSPSNQQPTPGSNP
jgi:hypothetical protein